MSKRKRGKWRIIDETEHASMVDSIRCFRQAPTEYEAPEKGDKMRALYAIALLGLSNGAKAVAAILIWHANSRTGRCDPGVDRIVYEGMRNRRSVEWALKELRDKTVLVRKRRGQSTNAYQINWPLLRTAYAEFERRAAKFRSADNGTSEVPDEQNRPARNCTSDPQEIADQDPQEMTPEHKKIEPKKENLRHEVVRAPKVTRTVPDTQAIFSHNEKPTAEQAETPMPPGKGGNGSVHGWWKRKHKDLQYELHQAHHGIAGRTIEAIEADLTRVAVKASDYDNDRTVYMFPEPQVLPITSDVKARKRAWLHRWNGEKVSDANTQKRLTVQIRLSAALTLSWMQSAALCSRFQNRNGASCSTYSTRDWTSSRKD
jgi:hypothetical protein